MAMRRRSNNRWLAAVESNSSETKIKRKQWPNSKGAKCLYHYYHHMETWEGLSKKEKSRRSKELQADNKKVEKVYGMISAHTFITHHLYN